MIDIFIQPNIKQRDLDPEKELAIYKLYAGNGLAFHGLVSLRARLDTHR